MTSYKENINEKVVDCFGGLGVDANKDINDVENVIKGVVVDGFGSLGADDLDAYNFDALGAEELGGTHVKGDDRHDKDDEGWIIVMLTLMTITQGTMKIW